MRAVVGMLAHWPVVYICGFFGLIALPPPTLHELFPILFPVHGLTILLGLGLTLVYAVDALRDERLDATQRLLWVLILFMGNLLALPLYYWMRVHGRDGWTSQLD